MKLLMLTCLCILNLTMSAQVDNNQPERNSHRIALIINKKSIHESDIKPSPYFVGPNVLQLYPGETVLVEVQESNGVINTMKTVRENRNPEKTLEISFLQNVTKKKHVSMMLKINNPFKKELTYSAKIFLLIYDKWVNTNVIPIKAGLSSFETWPDIIVTIGLSDWAFTK